MKKPFLDLLRCLGLPALGGLLLATPADAEAAHEVHVYGVDRFGTGACGENDMTHDVHVESAGWFADAFEHLRAADLWDQVSYISNGDVQVGLFADISKCPSCGADTTLNRGADDADVIYVHSHGGHNPNTSWIVTGNQDFGCDVFTDRDMLLGNPSGGGDLEIAVLKVCQSANLGTWQNGGYRQSFTNPGSGFTVWNGFHGDSGCGGFVVDYVEDYAASSVYGGVGENWLDQATYWADFSWEYDDCPVAIVMGDNQAARVNMYEHGGFRDRKDTGSKTGSTYFFMADCDPENGIRLPD
jgi:hypothetical protein